MKNLLQNTTLLAQAMWEHYLTPRLTAGDCAAVDATCGRGNDTLWLAAHCGRVYAFDIQQEAIDSTRKALEHAGIRPGSPDRQSAAGCGPEKQQTAAPAAQGAGVQVSLIRDSHINLLQYVREPIGLIVFNLGYLPGGDKNLATSAQDTLTALQRAAEALTVGGLLSVTMYWGHEAGKKEREEVLAWAAKLDKGAWHCVHTAMLNQPNCPPEILFVTRKKG